MGRFLAIIVLLSLVTSPAPIADSWPAATIKEVFSEWQQCERRGGLHQCRTTNQPRAWGPFKEPALR